MHFFFLHMLQKLLGLLVWHVVIKYILQQKCVIDKRIFKKKNDGCRFQELKKRKKTK